jgi:hypothetical protein
LEVHGCVGPWGGRALSGGSQRVSIERPDLVERALIGHQGARDKRLARPTSPRWGHGQALAEGPLRLETQAVRIGHGHQDQREGAGLMTEVIARALPDQALIHPAALGGDGAESGQ